MKERTEVFVSGLKPEADAVCWQRSVQVCNLLKEDLHFEFTVFSKSVTRSAKA